MINIYTDGACQGNPGPGGWGAIVEQDGGSRELSGREAKTTNNRMEVLAAIKGLEATPEGSSVTLHSDSRYLVNTMTKGGNATSTSTCGSAWTVWLRVVASAGSGCAAMPAIPRTSAPTC